MTSSALPLVAAARTCVWPRQLTNSAIDILTEAESSSEKRQREFAERSKMFEEELDVDETLSQLLVAEGFSELEEVAYIDVSELANIEGFDEELGEELQSRATEALERREEASRRGSPRTWALRMHWPKCRTLTKPCWLRWARPGIIHA